MRGFRFAGLTEFNHPEFVPGAVKYGDVPALLALARSGELWLAGEEGKTPDATQSAFTAAGGPDKVQPFAARDGRKNGGVEWLIR